MNLGEKIISYVVLIIVIVVGVKFLPSIPISSVITQKQSDFSVTGTGKVTVVPNQGEISLGVTSTKNSVKSAQNEVNQKINSITAAVKKLGVGESDIKTENYSVYPQYDYSLGRNTINGYQVSASLSIKIRDLDKINDVIDAATSLGANQVGGINFTVNDDRKKQLQKQARDEAVKDAKDKAESLSKSAGMTLGKIINIQESFPTGEIRPVYMAADKETSISTGSTDINSTVTLTYETR